MSLVEPDADVAAEAAAYRPAFSHLALLEQIPGVDVARAGHRREGRAADRSRELDILDERRAAARAWLESYAPERARLSVQRDALPAAADEQLDEAQRAYLAALATAVEAAAWDGETRAGSHLRHRQGARASRRDGRSPRSTSHSWVGRSGPRAGWLLAALDREFVIGRLREAAAAGVRA